MGILEAMIGVNKRLWPELVAFLVRGLSESREVRVLLLTTSTWNSLLESPVCSCGKHLALTSVPWSQIIHQAIWSCIHMDIQNAQSPKVLAETAALLRNFTGPHIIRQDEKRQAMEVFQ